MAHEERREILNLEATFIEKTLAKTGKVRCCFLRLVGSVEFEDLKRLTHDLYETERKTLQAGI